MSKLFFRFHKWHIAVVVGKNTQIRHHCKAENKTRMNMYENELEQALQHNDSAVSWRMCRTIACAVKGSRRQFQNAPRTQPSKQEFIDKHKKSAVDGGWEAEEITVDNIADMEPDFSDTQCVVDQNTNMLFDQFATSVHYTRNRKAYMPGDVPTEIWRLVLLPQWLLPNIKAKWGLGHSGLFHTPSKFHIAFKKCLAVIYHTKCLPIQAVCNSGATIPKKHMSHTSHTSAVEGTRTIHVYTGFTQCLIRVCMHNIGKEKLKVNSQNSFGAVKGKRREEAVSIQLHNMFVCKVNGWSSLTKLYDMRNAFYCVSHEKTSDYLKKPDFHTKSS